MKMVPHPELSIPKRIFGLTLLHMYKNFGEGMKNCVLTHDLTLMELKHLYNYIETEYIDLTLLIEDPHELDIASLRVYISKAGQVNPTELAVVMWDTYLSHGKSPAYFRENSLPMLKWFAKRIHAGKMSYDRDIVTPIYLLQNDINKVGTKLNHRVMLSLKLPRQSNESRL